MCTDCEIKTMEADLPLDMNFRGAEIHNKVIIGVCFAGRERGRNVLRVSKCEVYRR